MQHGEANMSEPPILVSRPSTHREAAARLLTAMGWASGLVLVGTWLGWLHWLFVGPSLSWCLQRGDDEYAEAVSLGPYVGTVPQSLPRAVGHYSWALQKDSGSFEARKGLVLCHLYWADSAKGLDRDAQLTIAEAHARAIAGRRRSDTVEGEFAGWALVGVRDARGK